MRDSINPNDIPVTGQDIVAGYTNGNFAWTAAGWARFPLEQHCTIDVNGTNPHGSMVLDVETGDATVAEAVIWAKLRKALGPSYPPIIYCNRATLTPLFNAMNAAGLQIVHDFRLWIATLDGTRTVADMTGVTAVQYQGATSGHHYDESIVYDASWLAPAPVGGGPYRHVLSGRSLAQMAAARHTTPGHLLSVTAGAYTAHDAATVIPGMIIYSTNP